MLLPSLFIPDLATAALRCLRLPSEQLTEFRSHLTAILRHCDPNKIERPGKTYFLGFLRSMSRPEVGAARYGNVHKRATSCYFWPFRPPQPERPSMPTWPRYMRWPCRRRPGKKRRWPSRANS